MPQSHPVACSYVNFFILKHVEPTVKITVILSEDQPQQTKKNTKSH